MRPSRPTPLQASALAALLVGAFGVFFSCSEDSARTSCPPLPDGNYLERGAAMDASYDLEDYPEAYTMATGEIREGGPPDQIEWVQILLTLQFLQIYFQLHHQ